ncbi:hypothetical protein LMG28688_05314 [Paraburkholderia caffeinitolerans]|uniref:Uncharacterized protein n=1 Tax=Paraburkholderia caffeinitolerans TaxID=1723730 RepID=A0A6J5GKN3_9BURK|nr:hypothetical protein LMG28688_05314 [Paraburkholderia caffeinitolerans]
MNDRYESRQAVAVGSTDSKPVTDRFTPVLARDINPNWAWAPQQGQYDWMDSNSPFIDLA